MSSFVKIIRSSKIFLCSLCIFQIVNSQPVSDTVISKNVRQTRDINPIEAKLIHTLNPKPILDTITEDEKCCNTQQHLIGRAFLNVVEKVTSTAANAIQLPKQSYNKATAGITEYLNQIGAKLVGLQKK